MGMSTVADLEKRYRVKLPKPAREFIESQAWKKYDGRFIPSLPDYRPGSGMKINFDDERVRKQGEEWDVEWGKKPYVPLGLIVFEDGEADAQFVVIDASKSACPVRMFEHESGAFVAVAKTLAGFLSSLTASTPAPEKKAAVKSTEVVAELGIERKKGLLYYVKANAVWENAIGSREPPRKLADLGVAMEPGYLYALDSSGNVFRKKLGG